jgi:hypothetical protein
VARIAAVSVAVAAVAAVSVVAAGGVAVVDAVAAVVDAVAVAEAADNSTYKRLITRPTNGTKNISQAGKRTYDKL